MLGIAAGGYLLYWLRSVLTPLFLAFSIAYMLANPLWGSLLDYVGLRTGMLVAVAIWSIASASHAFIGYGTLGYGSAFIGLVAARTLLGLGEGATFPGGFRTAMDSLPSNRQARGIAMTISVITNGLLLTPEVVDRLKPFGLTSVKITLDGDRDTHNRMRPLRGGQGTFDRIIHNIRQIAGKCRGIRDAR